MNCRKNYAKKVKTWKYSSGREDWVRERERERYYKEPTCVKKSIDSQGSVLPWKHSSLSIQRVVEASERASEALPHVCSRTYRQFSTSKHRAASHLAHCSPSSPSTGQDAAAAAATRRRERSSVAQNKANQASFPPPTEKKKDWLR